MQKAPGTRINADSKACAACIVGHRCVRAAHQWDGSQSDTEMRRRVNPNSNPLRTPAHPPPPLHKARAGPSLLACEPNSHAKRRSRLPPRPLHLTPTVLAARGHPTTFVVSEPRPAPPILVPAFVAPGALSFFSERTRATARVRSGSYTEWSWTPSLVPSKLLPSTSTCLAHGCRP